MPSPPIVTTGARSPSASPGLFSIAPPPKNASTPGPFVGAGSVRGYGPAPTRPEKP
jgi:hypothetical protein